MYKGGDLNPADCSSYRPVNILPGISKVVEKVIFTQIQQYVDNNQILPANHHGSRSGHTTTTAVIELYEAAIEAYENGEASALISVDQSMAYDLI